MGIHQDREIERVATLDLLRGLAALFVMVPHFYVYHEESAGTFAEATAIAAVEVFFVLSGFVLGPQIVLCASRANWTTLRTFLARRWMRTIPSYVVALLAMSIIFKKLGSVDFCRYVSYLQNLFGQHNVSDYYPVAWSLSVEEWYYLIFPAFLLGYQYVLGRKGEWGYLIIGAIILIAAITATRIAFGSAVDWGANVRRVVVFRIDSIAYGFLLYLLIFRLKPEWDMMKRFIAALALTASSAFLFYLNASMLGGDESTFMRYLHPFASALLGISAVTFFLSIDQTISSRWARAICTYAGNVSYPIYLFHLVIVFGLARAFPGEPGLIYLGIYVSSVFVVATIFHYSFERPLLAMRPRYGQTFERAAGPMTVTAPVPVDAT